MITGCHPDTPAQRERDASECAFSRVAGAVRSDSGVILQRVPWLRNQTPRASCVGHSFSGGIDGVIAHELDLPTRNTTKPPEGTPWASGISIWREARRRQGRIEQIDRGTRLQYAVEGLVSRGWDPYRPDEERDDDEAGKQDDLWDEMFAHDQRAGAKAARYRIWQDGADRLDLIDAALSDPTLVVVGAWYLRDAFFDVRGSSDDSDVVVDGEVGGGKNSHAMRVFGRRVLGGRKQYAIQNSWGGGWGGLHLPAGQWLRGCAWLDESAIAPSAVCHDLMVMRPEVNI